MGREAFIKRVWEWKAESGGTIISQLKRLGASCDWSRERFTMDEGLSRAVMKVFVALYREGLIYKDKRLVNWDPKLQDRDLRSRSAAGRDQGPSLVHQISDRRLATNSLSSRRRGRRPCSATSQSRCIPTMSGLKHLIGKHAILPLVGRRIPIIADDYADPEKGSGAVKITPAHDFNDFEVGKRHGLPLINVFNAEGKLNLAANDDFFAGVQPSAELDLTDAVARG